MPVGCHWFATPAKARAHWGDAYQGRREVGDGWLEALDWLANKWQGTPKIKVTSIMPEDDVPRWPGLCSGEF